MKVPWQVIQKTANGMKGEKLPTVEGPISFMMATTANNIHHEDQSRMLTLNLDENPQRIKEALRNKALGLSKTEVTLNLEPWHELHDFIANKKMEVVIPYAERIVDLLEIGSLKIQRDFPKFLSTIKACALVHFNHREQDKNGRILANENDYRIAYDLLNEPISQGLEASVKPGIREVVEAVTDLSKMGVSVDGISHSKLAEHMVRDRSVVGRNIHAAVSQGYLRNESPGQGREAKVMLGDRKLSNGSALPSPELVFKKDNAVRSAVEQIEQPHRNYFSHESLPW